MSFATIGAELHADPDFGLPCTVTVPEGVAVASTARAVNSQVTDPQDRAARRDRLSCFIYLLSSAIARPAKGTVVEISGDSLYAGTWHTAEAGEPTTVGEWRCPAVRVTTVNAIAPSAGSPRPPSA